MVFNKPTFLVVLGATFSVGVGVNAPIVGVIISKLLGYLTAPWEYLAAMDPTWIGTGEDFLKLKIGFFAGLMACIGIFSGGSAYIQKVSFGILGGNVTYEIRKLLYSEILQMNIGWFDHRENGTSVLTTSMAEDTGIINGTSSESLAPTIEANCAIGCGILIAFVFCWQQALICLVLAPMFTVGRMVGTRIMHEMTSNQNDLSKEAHLLCGDAIVNYKTVQSFGYVDRIVKKYVDLLEPSHKVTISS